MQNVPSREVTTPKKSAAGSPIAAPTRKATANYYARYTVSKAQADMQSHVTAQSSEVTEISHNSRECYEPNRDTRPRPKARSDRGLKFR